MYSSIHMDSAVPSISDQNDFSNLYHKQSFKQPARIIWLEGWKIEYMAIACPEIRPHRPIVIIGGAF